MGTLHLTNAQYTVYQNLVNRPVIARIFARVGLGQPAGFDNLGNPSDTPTDWLFDDPRLPGHWRIRVAAGPTIFFQEWDAPFGGSQLREVSLAALQGEQGTS